MLNWQKKIIIDIYHSMLINLFLIKTELIANKLLLNFCQKFYTYWLIILFDYYFLKQILFKNLKNGNESL